MSPSPVIAASDEQAGTSFGTTSYDTLPERSMEPTSEALSCSEDSNPNRFSFMKLAAEIRLEIYSYLLIAVASRPKDAEPKEKTSKAVALRIDSSFQQNNIACCRINCRNEAGPRIGLTPQILRTCKVIHREATPVLYGENLFQFASGQKVRFNDPNIIGQDKLEPLCRNLYQNPLELCNVKLPGALERSIFAVFLHRIGQWNAANLKRLRFMGGQTLWATPWATGRAGWPIQVVTQLLKCHVPRLRHIKYCHDHTQWDEFDNGKFEPIDDGQENEDLFPYEDVDVLNGDLYMVFREEHLAVYEAMVHMVGEITWLKQLSITGLHKSDPTWQKTEELQALVKNRR